MQCLKCDAVFTTRIVEDDPDTNSITYADEACPECGCDEIIAVGPPESDEPSIQDYLD